MGREGGLLKAKVARARETSAGTSNLAPDLKQLRLISPLIETLFRVPVRKNRL